jgi:hypothetical protein
MLNSKQQKTLQAIFNRPTRSSVAWADVEKLFLALGAEVKEGKGSAITVYLRGEPAYFHRPHPGKEAKKYQVEDARKFLHQLGIKP